MPKAATSSASKATRKKQEAKSAKKQSSQSTPIAQQPKTKKKKKDDAPKKKQYIAPVKPKGIQDPVDTYGLGLAGSAAIDPNTIVTLRLLNKRDEKTIHRALEDYDVWIKSLDNLLDVLPTLPVWTSHYQKLALHSSRRVRLLTASIHATLLSSHEDVRMSLLSFSELSNVAYATSWLCLAHDVDRVIRAVASASWSTSLSTNDKEGIDISVYIADWVPYLFEKIETATSFNLTASENTSADESNANISLTDIKSVMTTLDNATEDDQSKAGRHVSSALEALTYLFSRCDEQQQTDLFLPPFESERLWSLLDGSTFPVAEIPAVRKAAWTLLSMLIGSRSPLSQGMKHSISQSILNGAFGEDSAIVQSVMWQPLLKFLQSHPEVWRLSLKPISADDESSDSEEDETDAIVLNSSTNEIEQKSTEHISQSLLHFISVEAHVQPVMNFPAIIIVLLSIPRDFYDIHDTENAQTLVDAYWQGNMNQASFDSLLEVTLLLLTKMENPKEFAKSQLERILDFLLGKEEKTSAFKLQSFVTFFDKMTNTYISSQELSNIVDQKLEKLLEMENIMQLSTIAPFINNLASNLVSHHILSEILSNFFLRCANSLRTSESARANGPILVYVNASWLDTRHLLSDASQTSLDQLILIKLPSFILEQSDLAKEALLLFEKYILNGLNDEKVNKAWKSFFDVLPAVEADRVWTIMDSLLDLSARGLLPPTLANANLDHFVRQQVNDTVLTDSNNLLSRGEIATLVKIMVHPHPFIAASLPDEIVSLLAHQVESRVDSILLNRNSVSSAALNEAALLAEYIQQSNSVEHVPVGVFKAAALVQMVLRDFNPQLSQSMDMIFAKSLELPLELASKVENNVEFLLRDMIMSESCIVSPATLVSALCKITPVQPENYLSLLPHEDRLLELRHEAIGRAKAPLSLTWTDHLLPIASTQGVGVSSVFSSPPVTYLRVMIALLNILSSQMSLLRLHNQFILHIVSLRVLLQDEILEPARDSVLSAHDADLLLSLCDTLLTYSLSHAAANVDSSWHQHLTDAVSKRSRTAKDGFQQAILTLFDQAQTSASSSVSIYSRRSLLHLLKCLLRYADSSAADLERWVDICRSMQSNQSETFIVLVSLLTPLVPLNPKFDRLKHGIASDLSSVKPAQVAAKGEVLLRQLISFSSDDNSHDSFLPPQRAIFVLQNLQNWIHADEAELSDSTLAYLNQLCTLLAPGLQDMSGAHWDFMFDVVDMNIEYASWTDEISLPGLFHACRFLTTLSDLCQYNKSLREICAPRLKACNDALFNVAMQLEVQRPASPAHLRLIETLYTVFQYQAHGFNLTDDDGALDRLFTQVQSPLAFVRSTSWALAKDIVSNKVQKLAVEAELAEEGAFSVQLPHSLLNHLNTSAHTLEVKTLLTWQLCLEHLANASALLRMQYIESLRSSDLIDSHLLVPLLSLLTDKSSTDYLVNFSFVEADLSRLEDDRQSLILLAANTYYRALLLLPALVRNWVESIMDRQFSSAIASLTSKFFSPLIISQELTPLVTPTPTKQRDPLADDGMTVKVASNMNEVKATYMIDEQPMELSIRLPSEYPLVSADLSLKRVAVSDATYRSWLLSIQQIISSGDARIADALNLFERNVALHFEGVEPCAICYSIISIGDRRTPSKKCRTCKNIFHSSCLFKWFSTS